MGFIQKLSAAIEKNHSLLCVGLDPEVQKFPAELFPGLNQQERLLQWGLRLVEQTADLVCCYKPNIAFYEQYGPVGLETLRKTLAAVPADIPVLLDAKRGDIGSTAAAYARMAFEVFNADAVTVSPYLGKDSISPFLAYEGKTVFVLCQTSNPSAAEIQNFGPDPLYLHVARQAQTWGTPDQIAFVVGATKPEALAVVRATAPDSWMLAPGIGAQGGDLSAALSAGLTAAGSGVIIPVSRAVIYAADPRKAALELRDQINEQRSAAKVQSAPDARTALVLGLHDAGCVKFGNFTLASGKQSPIYVDLRRVVSYPTVFNQVVNAYIEKIQSLTYDRIAAIPYAALPAAAAIALKLARPMIYPRKEVKAHGTGQAIEGSFEAGQTVLAVEDVITTGGSIITALDTLKSAGLTVRDVVVLVDRQQGGAAVMAENHCALHAVLTIREIVDILEARGRLDAQMVATVRTYLEQA